MQQDRPLSLVVDDETKIRRLVARNLEDYGFDVIPAVDGFKALEVFAESADELLPDLILMDIMLPGMDGFECASRIRQFSDIPIIFLSVHGERTYKMQGFEAGADDYVTKPFAIDELVARIRAVLRRTQGKPPASDDSLVNGPLKLNAASRRVWVNGTEIRLADTEFRLLAALMKEPGTVMTHDHLLRVVWGSDALGQLQYLRVAFTRIRRKLEEAGLEGGVISAYSGVGYILRDLAADPLQQGVVAEN